MSYTIKNLRDTKDSAPSFGFGDSWEAHFAKDELDAQSTGVAYLVLNPGKRSPFGHRHDAAEEVYVVLSGSGRMRLDDDVVDLRPLDAIRVAPSVTRAFEAGDEGMSVLAVGPRHDGDGEIVQDFLQD